MKNVSENGMEEKHVQGDVTLESLRLEVIVTAVRRDVIYITEVQGRHRLPV